MNSIHLMVITKIVINEKWNFIEIIEIIMKLEKFKKDVRKINKNTFIKFVLSNNT